jgi:menaquinone-9 beta-reductase
LLGDASGMIAPICGNGMSMAMHAANMISNIILKEKTNRWNADTINEQYAKEWKANFSKRIFVGKHIQHLLLKPALSNVSVSVLQKMPFALRGLIGWTHGHSFYNSK